MFDFTISVLVGGVIVAVAMILLVSIHWIYINLGKD
jgi:hypothetical protein